MPTGDRGRREVETGMNSPMRWTRYAAGCALAALFSGSVWAQTATPSEATTEAAPTSPAEAAGPQANPLAEGVAAIVNDEIISTYDLRQRFLLLVATSGVRVNQQNLPEFQQQALRSLIDERLQNQELKRFDVKVEDGEVDQQIDSIANENHTTRDQLLAGLQANGVQAQTLRNQIRTQIGWQMLVSGRYGSRARVGDDQVQQTVQRIAAASAKPQYLVGEIYLDAATVGGMAEAMNGANQLVDQIQKGAPFQAVARQFSNAPTAASGGDGGWLISGEIEPEVEAALQQMQSGQLSLPIQARNGVWIVYLREKRGGGGSTMVSLKQAAIQLKADAPADQVAAAEKKLAALAPKLTCDNIVDQAKKIDAVGADLGESDSAELLPEFRDAVHSLKVGQVSAPVRTSAGVHVVALCGQRQAGVDVPNKDQVENRLYQQQMSMLSKRYLRDLRNSAAIEMR
jgi:peptidyl-prolyl cis-trans isomerase SurA